MDYKEFLKKYPTEKAIIDYFIKIRYPEGVKCNHCGSDKIYQRSKQYKFFDCNGCGNSFSVFKDTIFEHTSTDLQKWFYAIHLFLNAKKGISAKQLQRETGVTYKTAWRMLRQIRQAMEDKNNDKLYETIVEIDETYVGGKPRKDNKKGQKLTGKQLIGILNQICKGNNIVISDEFTGYNALKNTNYIHLMIDHTKMFADGDIHTNTVEGFFALFKRGVYGIYHSLSKKHLHRYLQEFSFRYNIRQQENGAGFISLLSECSGRLTYKELIANEAA